MKRFLLSIFIFLFTLPAISQREDFGAWMTFSLNKDFNKKFGLSIDQEFRLKENLSMINLFYTNIGFNYKPVKFLRISLVYRNIQKQKNDGTYAIRSRFYTDLLFKVKPGKWALSNRVRWQTEWRQAGYTHENGNVPETHLRNMVKIANAVGPRFSPYFATEVRWQLQNPREPWSNGFNRTRFITGADFKINNTHTVGTYFLFQKEFNVNNRQTLYIIGFEYAFSID